MRTIFLLSFYVLLGFTSPILANVIKSRMYGGDSTDYYTSHISLQNGTTVLISSTKTVSNITVVWLLAIDSSGDSLWSKTLGTVDNDIYVASLKTSGSGFYLVVKETYNDPIRKLQCNYRLFKFDDFGEVLWSSLIAAFDTNLESFAGILESPDNNVVLAGSKFAESDGNEKIWIVKVSPNGETLLKKTITDTLKCIITGFKATRGGYMLYGHNEILNNSDMYIKKIDTTFSTSWTYTFGRGYYDRSVDIVTFDSSTFYFCGNTTAYAADGNLSPSKNNDVRGVVISIDSAGKTKWIHSYGLTSHQYLSDVKKSPDGNIALFITDATLLTNTALQMFIIDTSGRVVRNVKLPENVLVDNSFLLDAAWIDNDKILIAYSTYSSPNGKYSVQLTVNGRSGEWETDTLTVGCRLVSCEIVGIDSSHIVFYGSANRECTSRNDIFSMTCEMPSLRLQVRKSNQLQYESCRTQNSYKSIYNLLGKNIPYKNIPFTNKLPSACYLTKNDRHINLK